MPTVAYLSGRVVKRQSQADLVSFLSQISLFLNTFLPATCRNKQRVIHLSLTDASIVRHSSSPFFPVCDILVLVYYRQRSITNPAFMEFLRYAAMIDFPFRL